MTTETIEARVATKIRKTPFLQDLGEILGIPIEVKPFWPLVRRRYLDNSGWYWDCSAGGVDRIKRPEVRNGQILLWEGPCKKKPAYGNRYHKHAQILEFVATAEKAILVRIRIGRNYAQYLVGVDEGSPYAVPVSRSLETVEEVFNWLIPKVVKEAIAQGLDVKRQGDWYFIPTNRVPYRYSNGSSVNVEGPYRQGCIYNGAPLIQMNTRTITNHTAGRICYSTPHPLVRGNIRSPGHKTVYLGDWHLAVRNKSTPWRDEIPKMAQRRAMGLD